ncbi:glutamate NMDA receptor-associated protein 1 lifeguard isoform X1 [Megalopta genalis]|uniref:glutamate NMDA receptor-associated protein 1 lifeguard isoform X1 n=2 Tax=Megalopta genalis TaxID=115081 RepID=UPI003FD1C545
MATWQSAPGYPPPQGYPQPNPGYPPQDGFNPGYPPPYGTIPPAPGFVPPPNQIPTQGGFSAHPSMYDTNYAEDPTQHDLCKGFDFNDKSIRRGFIRKVYSILMSQLLITVGIIALFLYHEPTKLWVRHHTEIFWICFAVTIVLIICMACCADVRRKSPMNFIFLFLFTLAESVLLGTAASTYNSEEVILAVGITAAVCFALTLFAFQTKIDFTGLSSFLFVALVILMLFGIITIFWHGPIVRLVYASVGALLFCIYLIYDTQIMLGGEHKYAISPEEYIFAALNLYLDVINIFIYILTIIGTSRD